MEVWGASGGGDYQSSGNDLGPAGLGGYSIGTIKIAKTTTVYAYVGGQGTFLAGSIGSAAGGWNGGGTGYVIKASGGEPAVSGGGATDFRIASTSLYARVIVAGGGGGCGMDGASKGEPGGHGGGSSGIKTSLSLYPSHFGTIYSGDPATQIAGWSFGNGFSMTSSNYTTYGSTNYGGSGGGGGWYGGYYPAGPNKWEGGGGGSGWVYTASTYSYWAANSTEGKTGNWLLNSNYYLTSASTSAGNTTFKSPSGSNETGHQGNGYARITWLGDTI